TIFFRNPVIVSHPLTRAVVRDNLGARRREHLVVAGLVAMIVRIEYGWDSVACNTLKSSHELFAAAGDTGVDQKNRALVMKGHHVGSAAIEHGKLVRQTSDGTGGSWHASLSSKQRWKTQHDRAGHRAFQQFSTIQINLRTAGRVPVAMLEPPAEAPRA